MAQSPAHRFGQLIGEVRYFGISTDPVGKVR